MATPKWQAERLVIVLELVDKALIAGEAVGSSPTYESCSTELYACCELIIVDAVMPTLIELGR